jgi:hypothetical protein
MLTTMKPPIASVNLGLSSDSKPNPVVHMTVMFEGWVLKKRRKKMQGTPFLLSRTRSR